MPIPMAKFLREHKKINSQTQTTSLDISNRLVDILGQDLHQPVGQTIQWIAIKYLRYVGGRPTEQTERN